ncbi:MAG: twin-arginine translocation signal domain-containing protein, partial [Actinobacteria bacterium]|nr:twin-arginine translocation signal domain-containing protein [Actinomycetota bacterium]NIS29277.1 twin-arginine translocation signal domain-containing protein [Actinomycetota bacterium]NIT94425.1 twin-arginine translocation signal domain-containing protein [Actinomycetota bacterium]NIU18041.1 twin-arginine translocation signal domain-containing protein [Actinomycetota bacterium]NIU64667.1 twin-arginine translocation signal domain-containing protein [Actinomycetota bacterium]
MTRQVLDRIDLAAARTGLDRRRFLTRSGAVAATLTVLNGCASGDGDAAPATSTSTTGPSTTSADTTTTSTTTT